MPLQCKSSVQVFRTLKFQLTVFAFCPVLLWTYMELLTSRYLQDSSADISTEFLMKVGYIVIIRGCCRGTCKLKLIFCISADERVLSAATDIFGRERFGSDRNDMGGVGTFSRENRTLYAGRVPTDLKGKDLESAARSQFGEFGNIEYVRVCKPKIDQIH